MTKKQVSLYLTTDLLKRFDKNIDPHDTRNSAIAKLIEKYLADKGIQELKNIPVERNFDI